MEQGGTMMSEFGYQETTPHGAFPQLDEKSRTTLADWLGDMVSLESHIEEALDRQLGQVKDDPLASEALRSFHEVVRRQRDALKALQEQYGGTAGSPIKEAGSALLGKAAGVINMLRTEGNSKALRDDYTAFNLAAIGYTMLHTTASALGDPDLARVAEQHLRGYAGMAQRINHLIEDVVLNELTKDGHRVDRAAAGATRTMVDRAWKETAQPAT
jgi:ferritin-like metal-binding protein YciE